MRILAVDDEPSILELLKAYLEAADAHEVTTASSGADALALIDSAECDFDCLLLDIQMPQMNGITLCELVRALPDYAHVPIIMLTAMSQKTYIDKAFSVGATDYITKPFDFMELRGRLQAATKIVYEHNRASDSAETARRLIMNMGTEVKPDPEEPLSIDGVDRVVGYAAFENFLLTLSRTKLLFATAFAVKVQDFKALHQEVSSREIRAILKAVAQAIVGELRDPGNVVSYRGNGVFLCINQKRASISAGGREAQINTVLQGSKGLVPAKMELRVAVGQEVSLVSMSRAGALVALRKAVDSVENRALPSKELATLSKRILRNQSRSQEQSKLERRAYELVLEDIVRDERRRVN